MKLDLDQIEWLDKCTVGRWKLDQETGLGRWKLDQETGLVDIDGIFDCDDLGLIDFKGIRFGTVTGYFSCHNNQLTSLVGAPEKVEGGFICSNNQLTSLVGAPEKVVCSFICHNNQLTSLVGAPESVGGDFSCHINQLTSLVGAPEKIGGSFDCSYNQLTSLEGAPGKVGRDFYCNENPVSEKSLLFIYKIMETSYPEALSEYWDQMPEDDKILMYRGHHGLTDDEKRMYELMNRVRGISI